ncbi:hypothetical protein BMETH_766_0 [methanotrophic bacterial endosymbiont of Bathymodiolus sp.]|nr:hypothetical protein BMETH_766_0 [methanotrophic bacterial endosymbiont of Bathymodiolus sp.]
MDKITSWHSCNYSCSCVVARHKILFAFKGVIKEG